MTQTAVVTGGGRGIGRAIARALADRGYAVLLTARDEEAGREAAQFAGPTAWSTTLDVRDADAHERVAAEAAERGQLAVWVNNAGVLATKKAWDHDAEELRLLLETNVGGTIAGSLAAKRAMSGAGRILNIASVSGLGPVPGMSVYAATKAAVVSFTMSLDGDLRDAGSPIRAHVLCPGAVATDMVLDRSDQPDAAALFAGTMLTPEDVARAGVDLIASRHVLRCIPRRQELAMRATALWPRAGSVVYKTVQRAGERRMSRPAADA